MNPHPTTERTAALIREWVSAVDRAAGPKPMALPFLSAGDPVSLARIALHTIHDGILAGDIRLARLALIVGAIAEHEAAGGDGGPTWGTEAQVRVGLALIDCAMRAAGWLALGPGPGGHLVVSVALGAMDAARHRLGREVPDPASYRPALRNLTPPYRTIKTLMGGKCLEVALAEAAEDLAGGSAEPAVREAWRSSKLVS